MMIQIHLVHYRTCLSAFFTSSVERQALGLPVDKESDDEGVDCDDDNDDTMKEDEEDATPAPRRGRRKKGYYPLPYPFFFVTLMSIFLQGELIGRNAEFKILIFS